MGVIRMMFSCWECLWFVQADMMWNSMHFIISRWTALVFHFHCSIYVSQLCKICRIECAWMDYYTLFNSHKACRGMWCNFALYQPSTSWVWIVSISLFTHITCTSIKLHQHKKTALSQTNFDQPYGEKFCEKEKVLRFCHHLLKRFTQYKCRHIWRT